jgi:putative oxidoreductase
MAKVDSRWRGWTPYLLSVLRIITAYLFVRPSAQKFLGFLGFRPRLAQFTQLWIVEALEFFGGLLVLLGLFTRPTAFILAVMMAVAYFQSYSLRSLWIIQNGGELTMLYCFVFLYLSAAGGGPWSLDSTWRRKG